ncbi:hypothetical protein [Cellulomonas terrae]|uniref:Core-binding (CB) domain-containing protein n=1 Tax=Cellulomonas terrae TaxID=311234 RepID=A0A511JPU4_9CELL|nr:hypothetical protein [Cellulomonas terrae]GEL99885.1 hypothetical protein CTE05_34320 [Cellulomonas terrae]
MTAVARYTPVNRQGWLEVGDFVRAVAVDLYPDKPKAALEAINTVAPFVQWAHGEGLTVPREALFTPDVVERYTEVACGHLAESSIATKRSNLRRYGRAITEKAPWPPPERAVRSHAGVAPYTDAEWRACSRSPVNRECPADAARCRHSSL